MLLDLVSTAAEALPGNIQINKNKKNKSFWLLEMFLTFIDFHLSLDLLHYKI